jgi:N-terminal domain of reverse transcriptase
MDKLGTTTQDATVVMADIAALDAGGDVVNGPEDLLDWEAIDWRDQEAQVQRLRQRIFKATQARDHKQVRNLQKLTAPRGALSYPRRSREELEVDELK